MLKQDSLVTKEGRDATQTQTLKSYENKYGQSKKPYDILSRFDGRMNTDLSSETSIVRKAERAVDSLFFRYVEASEAETKDSDIVVVDTSKDLPSGLKLS